jgi:hypothetical protein
VRVAVSRNATRLKPGEGETARLLLMPPPSQETYLRIQRLTFCGERKECDSSSLQFEALNRFQSCGRSVAIISRKTDAMKIVVLNFDPSRAKHGVRAVLIFTTSLFTVSLSGQKHIIPGVVDDAPDGVTANPGLSSLPEEMGASNYRLLSACYEGRG